MITVLLSLSRFAGFSLAAWDKLQNKYIPKAKKHARTSLSNTSFSGMNHLRSRLLYALVLLATWCSRTLQKNPDESADLTRAEEMLLQKLLVNYTTRKYVLPSRGSPVQLSVDMSLRQIAEVDEVKQGIRLNVWFRQHWKNTLLTWNPDEYLNITSVHLDKKYLWIPDTCLYNKAIVREDTDMLYRRLSTSVILKYDGRASWYAPAALFSQCNIDVTKFPFDEQVCPLTFGSWTYHGLQLNITYVRKELEMVHYVTNSQWKIVKAEFKRNVVYYAGAQQFYPDVTLELRIKRLPLYYSLNLIVPCTLIAVLSFVTFILPTGYGERVSLVMTVLLAMSVYMLIVSSSLPQSSDDIPKIGMYFLCIIVEIALCLFATCMTVKIQEKQTEIPEWLDVIVNRYLAKLVCVNTDKTSSSEYVVNIGYTTSSSELSKITDSITSGRVVLDSDENEIQLKNAVRRGQRIYLQGNHGEKIQSELVVISDHVREKSVRQARIKKWKGAAKVLDRFFLVVFVVLFMILTLIFFI